MRCLRLLLLPCPVVLSCRIVALPLISRPIPAEISCSVLLLLIPCQSALVILRSAFSRSDLLRLHFVSFPTVRLFSQVSVILIPLRLRPYLLLCAIVHLQRCFRMRVSACHMSLFLFPPEIHQNSLLRLILQPILPRPLDSMFPRLAALLLSTTIQVTMFLLLPRFLL